MMAGNPNSWWSLTNGSSLHPQESHQLSSSSSFLSPLYLYGPSSASSLSSTSMADHHHNQEFPRSWSQLLLGSGLPSDQERYGTSELCQYNNRLENWEQNVSNNLSSSRVQMDDDDEKQGVDQNMPFFGHVNNDEYNHQVSRNSWPHHQLNLVSSPTSCVTSLSSNLLNFASSNKQEGRRERSDNSTEGNNNSSTGGLAKKPRVQHSSTQPALKVRKEKLGDRITALHQLVSPFGKTDTASVLSEAIGYIRFLLGQIEVMFTFILHN
ncbi:hypothetical protein Leryth_010238 [Lithospermum erythrorhizon]|nr:hypothetical protein Leryth_010238 [Lithospermum erythrorhizon]